MRPNQICWTPAETYALETQATRQWGIAQILDGHLNGVLSDTDWNVLDYEEGDGENSESDDLLKSSQLSTYVPYNPVDHDAIAIWQ